jgi:periplasmic protein CpxP/Spy
MTNEPTPNHARRRGEHGRIALVMAIGLVLAAGLAFAGYRAQDSFGHHGPFARHSPRLIREFIEFRVDRALEQVAASDEQKRQVQSILARGFDEHASAFETHEALRQQVHELLTAETIDHAAVEALRAEQVQRIDAVSRQLKDAVVEIAELLTPEQRRRLVELHEQAFE